MNVLGFNDFFIVQIIQKSH